MVAFFFFFAFILKQFCRLTLQIVLILAGMCRSSKPVSTEGRGIQANIRQYCSIILSGPKTNNENRETNREETDKSGYIDIKREDHESKPK